jgi:hypothetical protein
MGFNGHSVNHLGNSSSLLVLSHLAGDGLVELLDLVLFVHALMVHDSLFMLDVKGVLTNVVLVLSFLEFNLTFVTSFCFFNSSIFDWVVVLHNTRVVDRSDIATVMKGFDVSNSLARVLA